MADDGPVLWLHMRAVVLLPGAAAGEGDALADTVPIQSLVDELRAVVAIQAPQGPGQTLPDFMAGGGHAMLPFAPDRVQLDPARGDIDGAECAEGRALGARRAVGHQVDLAVAGHGFVPVGKGAEGDLLFEPRAGLGGTGAAERILRAGGGEQAGEGGPARLSHQLLNGGGQTQFVPPQEPVKQLRHEGVQAMGADTATGLPEQLDGGRDLGAVLPRPPRPRGPRRVPQGAPQQANDRLAVHPGDRHDLIQQCLLLPPGSLLVPCPLSRRVFP